MKSPPRHQTAERGVVMVVAVFVVLVLGGLSAAFLLDGLGERTAVEHRRTSLMALQLCEAGTVRSVLEITALKDGGTDGIGVVSGPLGGGAYDTDARRDPAYPDRWTLTTTGVYALSTKRIEVGVRRRMRSDWVEGLFAKNDLVLNGDVRTDSYDSRLGTYATQAVNNDAGGPYAGGRGHLGSNATIRMTGSAMHVRGNAIPGPLSEVEEAGDPTIWGDTLPRRTEVPVPDVPQSEFDAALADNDNGTITWAGGPGGGGGKPPYNAKTLALVATGSRVVTLPGGTYLFSDVRFAGGATLRVTGPSVLYVTGQFDLGGGVIANQTGAPSSLRVYVHPYALEGLPAPTHSEVVLQGGPAAALAVYAPAVDVAIHGNGHVYGALVGRGITSTGDAYFHYDEALGAFDEHAVVHVERLYWRDLSARLR